MQTSIYIASQKIEVVGYQKSKNNVSVLEYSSVPVAEGTMINGKITDSLELVNKLKQLKAEKPQLFQDSTLVIDSNSLLTKIMPVPQLKKWQYYKLVKEELVDTADVNTELVFDYSILLDKGRSTNMLACAASNETVESYLQVFEQAGIPLKTIRVGLETIINFVHTRPDLMEKTFVLNIVDGFSMLSVIFENGSYIFSTRTRLMLDGELGYVNSMIQSLSSLIQFNQSEKLSSIAASYYMGLQQEQILLLRQYNLNASIQIDQLDTGIREEGCIFSYLGIFDDKTSINLIQSYKNVKEYLREHKPFRPIALLPYVVAACLLIAFFIPAVQIQIENKKIEKLTAYLESETIVKQSAEIDELIQNSGKLARVNKQFVDKLVQIEALPTITNELLGQITTTNQAVILVKGFAFDAGTNTIQVTGSSATESDSSAYVEQLKKSGLIEEIYYTGYHFDEQNRYHFTLEIVLATTEKGE